MYECLENEPIYISRKLCKGHIYILNQNEKKNYFKLDLMKLKTEMRVLRTKRKHFRNKLDGIDKEMTDFINDKNNSGISRGKIREKWVKN